MTELLGSLRADANWSYLKPRSRRTFDEFEARLLDHLARAEPGSLAHLMAQTPASAVTVPHLQVPQWLFAFDPAGIATWRTLVLLEGHPEAMERAVAEVAQVDLGSPHELPFVRACVLESLRPLVPFSAGPVTCPARNLVLLLTSAMLGALVEHHEYRLPARHHLDTSQPLPSLYDPFRVTFAMRRR